MTGIAEREVSLADLRRDLTLGERDREAEEEGLAYYRWARSISWNVVPGHQDPITNRRYVRATGGIVGQGPPTSYELVVPKEVREKWDAEWDAAEVIKNNISRKRDRRRRIQETHAREVERRRSVRARRRPSNAFDFEHRVWYVPPDWHDDYYS